MCNSETRPMLARNDPTAHYQNPLPPQLPTRTHGNVSRFLTYRGVS